MKECRLYFFITPLNVDTVEMHVGAIKEHRHMAKVMIEKALDYVKSLKYSTVVTWVPEKFQSTINMAKKFGFKEVYEDYSSSYGCKAIYLERIL